MTRKKLKQIKRTKKLKKKANIKRNNSKFVNKSKLLKSLKQLHRYQKQQLLEQARQDAEKLKESKNESKEAV